MTNTTSTVIAPRLSAAVTSNADIAALTLGVNIEQTIFEPHLGVGKHQFSVYGYMLDDNRVMAIASDARAFAADIMTCMEFDEALDIVSHHYDVPVNFSAKAVEELGRVLSLPTLEDLACV